MEWQRNLIEAKMGIDNEERTKQGLQPVDINQWAFGEEVKETFRWPEHDEEVEKLREYILNGETEQQAVQTLFDQGNQVVHEVIQLGNGTMSSNLHAKPQMSKYLLNAYIDFLGAYDRRLEMIDLYETRFKRDNMEADEQTYSRLVYQLLRPKIAYTDEPSTEPTPKEIEEAEVVYHKSWSVYEDFEHFRRLAQWPDDWSDLDKKYTRNKWLGRGIGHRHRAKEYFIMTNMIKGLTNYDDLDRAINLVNMMVARGHFRHTSELVEQLPKKSRTRVPSLLTELAERRDKVQLASTKQEKISNLIDTLASASTMLVELDDTCELAKSSSARATDLVPLLKRARELNRTDIADQVAEILNSISRPRPPRSQTKKRR
jgi:hypothetical protein